MPRPSNNLLTYAAAAHRVRRPGWINAAGAGAFAAAVGAALYWRTHDRSYLYVCGGLAAAFGVLALIAWALDWADEWRIEGDMLVYRANGKREFTSLCLDDIREAVLSSYPGRDGREYEFLMRDGRVVRVPATVFEPHDEFKAAVREANPSIRFSQAAFAPRGGNPGPKPPE